MTREEILNSRNFGVKEIETTIGKVFIRKWSGKDRAKFLQASISVNGENIDVEYDRIFDNMSLVVVLSLCNETGERMFTDGELELIGELDADAIQEIYQESLKLNSLAPKSVEEAAKNSKPVRSEDSTTG